MLDQMTSAVIRLHPQDNVVILTQMGQGMSNKQIARRLAIQDATVKNHVHSILGKLGVSRRGEAVAQWHAGGAETEAFSLA